LPAWQRKCWSPRGCGAIYRRRAGAIRCEVGTPIAVPAGGWWDYCDRCVGGHAVAAAG
jgi:hypothetical protein